ncbi:MAG: peptidoglycan DD-metalloendopeptidase family protein [Terriglobia bacterium]
MSIESSLKPSLPTTGLDFSRGIDGLRHTLELGNQSSETERLNQLRTASQQFEALFVGYMLKVMRSTVDADDEESKALGKDIYMDMFDNEIASNIAKNRSLGIGELLYQQLTEREKVNRSTALPSPSQKSLSPAPSSVPLGPVLPSPDLKHPTATDLDDQEESDPEKKLWTPLQGELTSAYGYRPDPETRKMSFHRGMDIAAPLGTPFHAAQSGTVVYSGMLGSYGNTIVIEHAGGFRSLYAHASRVLVSPGETVTAEQPIGIVGNTGHSRGAHLHFELQRQGIRIDPAAFLPPQQTSLFLNSRPQAKGNSLPSDVPI